MASDNKLSRVEAARMLGLSVIHVTRLARAGKLAGELRDTPGQPRRCWWFASEAVAELAEARRQSPPKAGRPRKTAGRAPRKA